MSGIADFSPEFQAARLANKEKWESMESELATLRAENERLREALVAVACQPNDRYQICWCGALGGLAHPCMSKKCAKARAALATAPPTGPSEVKRLREALVEIGSQHTQVPTQFIPPYCSQPQCGDWPCRTTRIITAALATAPTTGEQGEQPPQCGYCLRECTFPDCELGRWEKDHTAPTGPSEVEFPTPTCDQCGVEVRAILCEDCSEFSLRQQGPPENTVG